MTQEHALDQEYSFKFRGASAVEQASEKQCAQAKAGQLSERHVCS